jgi:hypothetical protein
MFGTLRSLERADFVFHAEKFAQYFINYVLRLVVEPIFVESFL